MVWKIDFTEKAIKQLRKIDQKQVERIFDFFHNRISSLKDPHLIAEILKDAKFLGAIRYRIGDYRAICHIDYKSNLILVIEIGHRKDIYG